MPTLLHLDVSQLEFYRNAPDNYCHFVLGNLFEVYVGLLEQGLLDADLELTHSDVHPSFAPYYAVFTKRPIERTSAPPVSARCLQLRPSADWSTLETTRDLAELFPRFRAFMWKQLLAAQPEAARQVTLIRRNPFASNRYVINEAQLVERLERECRKAGLELCVVDFAKLSFHEQVETMARTRVLIGIHGAGLVNTLFLPEHASVIELLPHRRFLAEFFRAMGMWKGNPWIRLLEPTWSVPSLYNLWLALVKRGHTQKNRFYRDRSGVYEPDALSRAFERALACSAEPGAAASVDIDLSAEEKGWARKLGFLRTHRKFWLATGIAAVAGVFLWAQPLFWPISLAFVTVAFFV